MVLDVPILKHFRGTSVLVNNIPMLMLKIPHVKPYLIFSILSLGFVTHIFDFKN